MKYFAYVCKDSSKVVHIATEEEDFFAKFPNEFFDKFARYELNLDVAPSFPVHYLYSDGILVETDEDTSDMFFGRARSLTPRFCACDLTALRHQKLIYDLKHAEAEAFLAAGSVGSPEEFPMLAIVAEAKGIPLSIAAKLVVFMHSDFLDSEMSIEEAFNGKI